MLSSGHPQGLTDIIVIKLRYWVKSGRMIFRFKNQNLKSKVKSQSQKSKIENSQLSMVVAFGHLHFEFYSFKFSSITEIFACIHRSSYWAQQIHDLPVDKVQFPNYFFPAQLTAA
jgi:hypothetical protein